MIKAGSTTSYFRVGYDLFNLTRTIFIKFTIASGKVNGPGTYAEIKPIRIVIYPSTSVKIEMTPFSALAAGGRSNPLSFYLDAAPFQKLTVGIYQIGSMPDKLGIYPSQLIFQPGILVLLGSI